MKFQKTLELLDVHLVINPDFFFKASPINEW